MRLNSTVINKKVHEELNIPISDIDAISNSIFSSLNDWFRDHVYKDTLDYIKSVGCDYCFEELPLEKIKFI